MFRCMSVLKQEDASQVWQLGRDIIINCWHSTNELVATYKNINYHPMTLQEGQT